MANPIVPVKRPDQLLTFPICSSLEIKRELATLLRLQDLALSPVEVDLGAPADVTTFVLRLLVNGARYTFRTGNVLVKLPTGDLEKYDTVAEFLAV